MPFQPASNGEVFTDRPLPYVDRLETRPLADIRLIVIHCTELPDLPLAREYGERIEYASGTGNSGHYYIDRDGRIERWVPEDRIAHHVRDRNRDSLGIELVNTGRWPNWYDSRRQVPEEPYPDAQIQALAALVRSLEGRLPALAGLAGHEDLDTAPVTASDRPDREVRRKIDPGPLFPWPVLLSGTALPRITAATGTASHPHAQ